MKSIKEILPESSECTALGKENPDFSFWYGDMHDHYGKMNKFLEFIQINRNI